MSLYYVILNNDRVGEMAERVGLTPAEIRRFSTLGLDTLIGLKTATGNALRARAQLRWTGRPTYDEIQALCTVICSVERPQDFGCGSDRQLAMYINQLRSAVSMRAFYSWHSTSYRGEPQRLDNVFKFLRAAEYNLPEYISVVELFVKKLGPNANYSLLLAELPRWFRAEQLKILEEQGVPIQISERFLRQGDTVADLGTRLRSLARQKDARLSALERQWILEALPA